MYKAVNSIIMKKLKICLSRLPDDVAENIKNLENDLPIIISANGILIETEKANSFTV